MNISIVVANDSHVCHAATICQLMAEAAQKRGTGIAKRSPDYLQQKMLEGKAIIALANNEPIGFCYIESWGHDKFVANSGEIGRAAWWGRGGESGGGGSLKKEKGGIGDGSVIGVQTCALPIFALANNEPIGFCYIESWGHDKFVANSGLIVHENYRKTGLAKQIKTRILELSRHKFPHAKLFGITTSLAVMKINTDLGYKPVTFSELTDDDAFWKGCNGCVNMDILQRTERKLCLCTGMLLDPVTTLVSPQNTTDEKH